MTNEAAKAAWWLLLIWGILSLIIGAMFLTTPALTTSLFIMFVGAYWLVGGIFTLASLFVDTNNRGWKLFLAVIHILAGIVILLYPFYSTFFALTFFIIFVGFWGCFIGFAHLYQAFKSKDAGSAVLGIISLVFGLLLLIFPFYAVVLVPFVIGIFAIVFGIAAIISAFAAKGSGSCCCCKPE